MSARIYARCDVCGTPIRLPRRTFHALTDAGISMTVWFLCRKAHGEMDLPIDHNRKQTTAMLAI